MKIYTSDSHSLPLHEEQIEILVNKYLHNIWTLISKQYNYFLKAAAPRKACTIKAISNVAIAIFQALVNASILFNGSQSYQANNF